MCRQEDKLSLETTYVYAGSGFSMQHEGSWHFVLHSLYLPMLRIVVGIGTEHYVLCKTFLHKHILEDNDRYTATEMKLV